ncbi:hypothetical protein LSH36_290g03016 [Paralvinella palmiformis]|uniref:Membrane protein BRI3 n=1 Tax=Paralvinella palmiformis TaxID=53620 RepID=A0AAD9JII7_9ANNE|nr:hypothetical protein LSH36_290g03016 [Paralvinella palmiformis]
MHLNIKVEGLGLPSYHWRIHQNMSDHSPLLPPAGPSQPPPPYAPPAGQVGVLEDDFTCLGICCGILFFPLGLICCLLMRQRRCPNCGAIFG